jgi:hypothetical protein
VNDRLDRHYLTDEEWQRLVPVMTADARQGRRPTAAQPRRPSQPMHVI